MTTGCVLDVLIYVYDHYMMSDPADIPGRAKMLSELAREGFTVGEVVQAMEWLSVLAGGAAETVPVAVPGENARFPAPLPSSSGRVSESPDILSGRSSLRDSPSVEGGSLRPAIASESAPGNPAQALRVYCEGELWRLSPECRAFLARLDRGVLTPGQRELVIERTLALDVEEPTLEQLRWVVLLVLSIQPKQEAAFARFEALMAGERSTVRH